MNPTLNKRPNRERRVLKVVRRALILGLIILTVSAIVALLRSRAQGDQYDALTGSLIGWLTVLPVILGMLLYRAYRVMDEFGQRLQERACAAAFLVTLLAGVVVTSTGIQSIIPVWAVCLIGVGAYGLAVLHGNRAALGEEEAS